MRVGKSFFPQATFRPEDGTGSGATPDTGMSVADIMAFDPFGPSETGDGGAQPPAPAPAAPTPPADVPAPGGAKPQPAVQPPAAPGTTPATATPATPASPPAQQLPTGLEEQLRQNTEAIRAIAEARTAPAGNQPPAPTPPKFNLAIPPEILNGIRSEDPTEVATSLHAVVNGLANHIWAQVTQHLEQTIQPSYETRARQLVAEHLESVKTTQEVFQDFYGTHVNLNNEMIKPMVQQAGVLVAKEFQAAGKSVAWSAELRDAIAEKIYAVMPHLRTQAAPQQQPPRQRYNAGQGSRPVPADPAAAEAFGADLLTG